MDPVVIFIIVVVAIFGLFAVLRRSGRGPVRGRAELVRTLLGEVNIAQALVDNFGVRPVPLPFQTGTWFANRERLQFLGENLRKDLGTTFGVAQDFNQRLKVAKKGKPAAVKVELAIEKIRGPLERSKKGLEDWLLANVGTLERKQKYPTILGGLFGGDN